MDTLSLLAISPATCCNLGSTPGYHLCWVVVSSGASSLVSLVLCFLANRSDTTQPTPAAPRMPAETKSCQALILLATCAQSSVQFAHAHCCVPEVMIPETHGVPSLHGKVKRHRIEHRDQSNIVKSWESYRTLILSNSRIAPAQQKSAH